MKILDIIYLANNVGQCPNEHTPIGTYVVVRDELFERFPDGIHDARYGKYYRKIVKIVSSYSNPTRFFPIFTITTNNRDAETFAKEWLKIV